MLVNLRSHRSWCVLDDSDDGRLIEADHVVNRLRSVPNPGSSVRQNGRLLSRECIHVEYLKGVSEEEEEKLWA